VSETVSTGLESGLVISSRYRVVERLSREGEPAYYAALDIEQQHPVLVLEVSAAAAKLFTKAKSLGHAHLANVLDVSEHDHKHLVVCERVEGETLAQHLADSGTKPAVDAVRSALRVADALSSLHEAGGAHGSVHPKNLVLTPEGREGPVLVFAPLALSDAEYHQPEWESGDGASEPDDSWAAAGLLHVMLIGEPPPHGGYDAESALADAGVDDPALQVGLYHALARDLGARSHDLRPLKRELARWFVEHAGEEPIAPGPHSTQPPPLPPSVRPSEVPRSSQSARSSQLPRPSQSARASQAPRPSQLGLSLAPSKKPSMLLVVASFGVAIGLIGGWVFSHFHKPNLRVVEVQKPAPAAPEKKAFDLSEVPVNGQSETESTDKIGSCVSGYLPKGSFEKAPDMSWVCEQSDPVAGAEKLRVAVINGGKGSVTEAMKIFSRIGWNDMAAYAVVRAGCCEGAKPLSLPPPSAGCTAMDEALRDIASAVVASRSYDEPMKTYVAAIQCELTAGRGAALHHTAHPASGEDSAFGELVHAVQP
jgi:hypothetical protein